MPNYPVDRRDPRRITAAGRGPIGDFELTAANVVARLTGERVVLQDDGSKSRMPDIVIERQDESLAYVEVVVDMSKEYGAMYSETLRRGQTIDAPGLGRVWFLILSGKAQMRAIDREAVPLLRELETAGGHFDWINLADLSTTAHPSLVRLDALGVAHLSSGTMPAAGAGLVRLLPMGSTGPSEADWPPVLAWIDDLLASPKYGDVRRKLGAVAPADRHLFLGLTHDSLGEAVIPLSHFDTTMPAVAPTLPEEITHLWVMSLVGGGRCLAWFPDRGWFDVSRHWATE